MTKALKHRRLIDMTYIGNYVADLRNVVDMEAIRMPALASASIHWAGRAFTIGDRSLNVIGSTRQWLIAAVDPTFRFMPVDWDGKIRMDCSSPYAMAGLVSMRDRFDVAFANDTDTDRHGIVSRTAGLLNPNHYLAVAISYLFNNRENWPTNVSGRQDRRQQRHYRSSNGPSSGGD